MPHGIGLDKIFSTILIYPTLAEANKYVAGVWKKMPSTVACAASRRSKGSLWTGDFPQARAQPSINFRPLTIFALTIFHSCPLTSTARNMCSIGPPP